MNLFQRAVLLAGAAALCVYLAAFAPSIMYQRPGAASQTVIQGCGIIAVTALLTLAVGPSRPPEKRG
jgi:hypothetical protein